MVEAGRAARMEAALRAAFAPRELAVLDESAQHAGHAGARPEGETHFAVTIQAAAFDGLSRIARSRAVHAILADEFARGLHALRLSVRGSSEN